MELDLNMQDTGVTLEGDLPEYDTPVESSKPKAEKAANEGAFYNTSLTGSTDIINDFKETRDNIISTGKDPSLENTKAELAQTNSKIVTEQAIDLISDSGVPIEQKKQIAYAAQDATNESVDIPKEYMLKEAAGYVPVDLNNQEVHENLIEGVDEIYAARRIAKKDVLDYISKKVNLSGKFYKDSATTSSILGVELDFLGAMVPFNISQTYRNIIERTFGESEAKYAYLLAPGEGLKFIKDNLASVSDPKEFVQLVRELIKNIDESAGTFDNNDFIKWQLSHEIFKDVLDNTRNPNNTDWDRVIDNVTGALDTILVGGILGSTYQAGKAFALAKNSPIDITSHVNPDKTKQLIGTAVVDDTGEVAKILSTTREDLIESTLYPKPLDRVSHQKMPADVADVITDVRQKANDIITRTETFGFAFKQSEKEAAVSSAITRLEKTAGAKYYQNMSEISADSEALIIRAKFGYDENHGFKNGLEASRKGKELFPGSEIKIYKRNKAGEIVPTNVLSSKGEYFFEVRDARPFNKNDELYFEPGSVNHAGLFGIGPTSPSAKFPKFVSDIGAILPGLEKKVQTDLLSVLKSFTDLGVNSKNLVSKVILKGYKEGKMYGYDDLISMGLNNKEIKGYYSIKGIEDLKYVIENRKVYKDLRDQGMLSVSHQKNGYKTIAKPVSEAEAAAKAGTAYDPTTGAIRALTPDEVASIYKNGDSIGYMYGTERAGENITNYIILDSKAGVRVDPLPAKVLNYDPGYITRVYKNRYFIDETSSRVINGKRKMYTRTVHAAGTEREALEHIAKLRESAEEGVTYNPRIDRGLSQAEMASKEKDLRLNKGALFTGTRGKHLTTDFGLAEIDEPVEALLRTIGTVSRHASHTDVMASMKQRWMNSYGDMFGNRYPTDPKEFIAAKGANLETVKDVKDAEAYWKYINLLDNVDPSGKIVDIRAHMIKFGEWVLGKGDSNIRNIIGNKVLDASAIDPLGRVRSLAFNMYLAGNPLRQIFIQSAQYMFLAGIDPKYSTYVFSKNGLARQKIGLDLAMASYTRPDVWKKVKPGIAKVSGMTEQELETLVKSFRESGLPFSIDSHTFVRDSLQDYASVMSKNNVTAALKGVATFPKKMLGAARKIGFDYGEYNNLSNTWLFARNRWMKNNPNKDWLSRSAQDQIAADARQYSLNMTKTGSFNYQRGIFSIPTQFLSIQHKALEAMLPVKVGGSRFFTAAEKRRIAVGQVLLYGTAGLGIAPAYTYIRDRMGIKVDQDVDKLMVGGLSEFVVNNMLQSIYGDDTSIRLSKDFAPVSGILETNIQKALFDFFSGGESPLTYIPAYTAGNRIYKAFQYGQYINQAPHIDTTDKLKEVLNSGIAVFSGYNNYLKAQAAINLGHMVDATGDPVVQATYAEAMAKLFGLQSEETADYYDVLQKSFSDVSGKRQTKHIQSIAQTYYDNLSKRVAFFGDEVGTMDDIHDKRLKEAIQAEAMILSVLKPMEAQAVLAEFRAILARNIENGSDRLIANITKNAMNGKYGDSWSTILSRLRNSSLANSPEKEEELKRLFDFMTEEQAIIGK